MKKFVLLTLVFVLSFSLCACRMGTGEQPSAPTTVPTTAPTTEPTSAPTNPTEPNMPSGPDFMDPSYETVEPNGGTPVG